MSTHRAPRHRANKAVEKTLTSQCPTVQSRGRRLAGRGRAGGARRRTGRVTSASLLGGLALLATAVVAAVTGQAIFARQDMGPTSAEQSGSHVASMASALLQGRDTTAVSRGAARPTPTKSTAKTRAPTTDAKRVADQRNDTSRSTADAARNHPEQPVEQRRERRRDAATGAENDARQLTAQRIRGGPGADAGESSRDDWVLPTSGFHISTLFGVAGPYWASGYHTGIDFATAYGTPTVSVAEAVVVKVGWDGGYGNQVRLQLENGDEVWYNHLASIAVVAGQQVATGQQVGRIGETGNAYGAHLHFEYRLASNLHDGVDPVPFLVEHGLRL